MKPTCSRAGCSAAGRWKIIWRNPAIHDESREKIWLACDDHQQFLEFFLAQRNFPVRVESLTDEH